MKKVTVLRLSGCGHCKDLVGALDKAGVKYTSIDADENGEFADNYIPSYNKLEEVGNHHYYKNSFGIIEELHQQKTNFEMMFSLLSYNFVESNLKKQTHHNNLYGGLIIRLEKIKEGVLSLNKINEILANESKWLGYDNSLILNMNRFI